MGIYATVGYNFMNRILSKFCIVVVLASCTSYNRVFNIKTFDSVHYLNLESVDNKCGEWGGNNTTIRIYRNQINGPILADYHYSTMECNGTSKLKDSIILVGVVLENREHKFIFNSINELLDFKLEQQTNPSHDGIYNSVVSEDSTLIIKDSRSLEWGSFKVLSKIILEKSKQ